MAVRAIFISTAVAFVLANAAHVARAGDIVEEWAKVQAPSAPVPKPVTIDAKTTALLVVDCPAGGRHGQGNLRRAATLHRIGPRR
jgi:hypothetical protein